MAAAGAPLAEAAHPTSMMVTPVPETVGVRSHSPARAVPPDPLDEGTPTFTVGGPSAEDDSRPPTQTAAPTARLEGVEAPVKEGVEVPDMVPPRPAGSNSPILTRAVGVVGEPLVPTTVPTGPEAKDVAKAGDEDLSPPSPIDPPRGKAIAARGHTGGPPALASPGPASTAPQGEASTSQASRDAAATIAAVGGPAPAVVAAQVRKPPPRGISLRRSRPELQAVLEAEPYPGPFPMQRPAWGVPVQGHLGDDERPVGAPLHVRIGDLYPGKV